MNQLDAIDIFNEITAIYDAQINSAQQIITDHQRKMARRTVITAIAYITPPPRITTAEWADEFRYLAAGTTAKPGKWKTDRRPFLRGIMDAFDDPMIDTVTIKKASRMGITECINNKIGRHIHYDPCAMMYVQQTLGEAKKYNAKIFRPFINATKVLRDILPPEKSRNSGSTILEKSFPGGTFTLVGANVATGFRMVYVQLMFLDDVDGFAWTVGKEGDPVKNAAGRTVDTHGSKIIMASKPTIKGYSRIDRSYEESDKQLHHVPCPHCDHGQVLRWGGKDLPYGVKWRGDDPYSAYYLCEQCSGVILDFHKDRMLAQGDWFPSAVPKDPRHRGFGELSQLYHPDIQLPSMVKDFLSCGKNPEDLQVFFNDRMGECWDDKGEGLSENILFDRREDWTPGLLPEGVACLTGAGDVGENHIAASIVGWGKSMECWVIHYQLFEGDTLLPEIWEDLRKYVMETWKHSCGIQLRPMVFGIDSRYRGEMVGNFVRTMRKSGVNVIAIQGQENTKSGDIVSGTVPSKKNARLGTYLYNINDDKAKLSVLGRLKIPKPGGGYIHFPKEEWCNLDYFDQLLSEKKIRVREKGVIKEMWIQKPGVRNEPFDAMKYNLSMLILQQKHKRFDLDKAAEAMALRVEEDKLRRMEAGELPATEYFMQRVAAIKARVQDQKRSALPKKKPNWVTGWRR